MAIKITDETKEEGILDNVKGNFKRAFKGSGRGFKASARQITENLAGMHKGLEEEMIPMVKRYTVTLSSEQDRLLDSLAMGNTKAEKIRNIVISWLSEKSIISSSAKKKLKI